MINKQGRLQSKFKGFAHSLRSGSQAVLDFILAGSYKLRLDVSHISIIALV